MMSLSLMELGRRIRENQISLEDALREMKEGSCSVSLSWSEDDGELWECSWIVGGARYSGYDPQPRTAVLGAVVAHGHRDHKPELRRAPTEYGGVVYTDDKPITE